MLKGDDGTTKTDSSLDNICFKNRQGRGQRQGQTHESQTKTSQGQTGPTHTRTSDKCGRCRGDRHTRTKCPVKDTQCHNCKMKGHYSRVQYSTVQLQLQYSTVQYSTVTVQYSTVTVQYSTVTVQYSTVQLQYSTVQYSTVQYSYSTVQYSTVQYSYSTVQYSTVTVQYSTVQYSTVQYSTVQYSTVQYSTVQYSTVCHNKSISTIEEYIPQHFRTPREKKMKETGTFVLTILGKQVTFKVDTGAGVTAISKATWEVLDKPTLQPPNKHLYGPSQQPLKSPGSFLCSLNHKGKPSQQQVDNTTCSAYQQ